MSDGSRGWNNGEMCDGWGEAYRNAIQECDDDSGPWIPFLYIDVAYIRQCIEHIVANPRGVLAKLVG